MAISVVSPSRHREERPGVREGRRRGDLVGTMSRQSYVYIMTNQTNRVLYTGVTTDLLKRISQHKEGIGGEFTKKYNIKKLVYFEIFEDVREAIAREKQIKKGSRRKKVDLIEAMNPSWSDLYDDLL